MYFAYFQDLSAKVPPNCENHMKPVGVFGNQLWKCPNVKEKRHLNHFIRWFQSWEISQNFLTLYHWTPCRAWNIDIWPNGRHFCKIKTFWYFFFQIWVLCRFWNFRKLIWPWLIGDISIYFIKNYKIRVFLAVGVDSSPLSP